MVTVLAAICFKRMCAQKISLCIKLKPSLIAESEKKCLLFDVFDILLTDKVENPEMVLKKELAQGVQPRSQRGRPALLAKATLNKT